MRHSLIFIAIVLAIVWVVARVALAVTAIGLHLLWIAAVVLAIVWVARRFKKKAVES